MGARARYQSAVGGESRKPGARHDDGNDRNPRPGLNCSRCVLGASRQNRPALKSIVHEALSAAIRIILLSTTPASTGSQLSWLAHLDAKVACSSPAKASSQRTGSGSMITTLPVTPAALLAPASSTVWPSSMTAVDRMTMFRPHISVFICGELELSVASDVDTSSMYRPPDEPDHGHRGWQPRNRPALKW